MNTTRSSQGLFILAKVRKAPIKKAQSKLSTAAKKDNYFTTVGNTTIKFY
jgi:hypothetical protein